MKRRQRRRSSSSSRRRRRERGAGATPLAKDLAEPREDVRLQQVLELQPGATPSFYSVIDCHWLSFLTDLHSNLAVIAVISVKMKASPWAIELARGAAPRSMTGRSRDLGAVQRRARRDRAAAAEGDLDPRDEHAHRHPLRVLLALELLVPRRGPHRHRAAPLSHSYMDLCGGCKWQCGVRARPRRIVPGEVCILDVLRLALVHPRLALPT